MPRLSGKLLAGKGSGFNKNVERQELQLFFSKNEWSKNARPLQAFLPTNTCLLLNMQRTDEGLPAQVNPSMVMSSFQLGQVQF